MIEYLKEIHDKKIQKRYEKNGVIEGWYDENLKKYGPLWMYDELYPFMSRNQEVLVLSPSANKAKLEYNTYKTLKKEGFHCKFIVSDLCGKSLYINSKGEADFIFVLEDKDASDIKLTEKPDIIIDIKGAIWYSLNARPKFSRYKRLIKLLNSYVGNMKDENSLLIVDAYKINNHLYGFRNVVKYRLRKGKEKKENKNHEEQSTLFYINRFFKKRRIANLFTESESQNPMIHIAYIKKGDLIKTIYELENRAFLY